MNGIVALTGVLSAAGISASLWGTLRAYKVFGTTVALPVRQPPVTILKPIKGADPGSEACLESFFLLDYPEFELLISIAKTNDPIVPIVQKLQNQYPNVRCSILYGVEDWGLNPKVNTMARAYKKSSYEWLWISDAQVIVAPNALQKLFSGVDNSVGLVSGVVCGIAPESFSGRLECTFLNSFYAKWSLISESIGTPCVMGKSMLFRKETFERMGGIKALGNFLAEDFMAGQGIQYLGLKVKMQQDAIFQSVGAISWQTFWSRHLRWGRIRKAQAPIAYWAEPLLMTATLVAAFGTFLQEVSGMNLMTTMFLSASYFYCCDFILSWLISKGQFRLDPIHWLIRELIHVPLWFHIGASQKINWRGNQMAIQHGGLLRR